MRNNLLIGAAIIVLGSCFIYTAAFALSAGAAGLYSKYHNTSYGGYTYTKMMIGGKIVYVRTVTKSTFTVDSYNQTQYSVGGSDYNGIGD